MNRRPVWLSVAFLSRNATRCASVVLLGLWLQITTPAHAADPSTQPVSQKMRQDIGKWKYLSNGRETEGPYIAYTPATWDNVTRLPLLISLHGAGYRGHDISLLYADEVLRLIRAGKTFDAIVLCPQVDTYWSGQQAAGFIDQALEKFAGRFDPDRVYLTGESSGGGGAWEAAKLRAPVLAALVPIATTIGKAEGAEKLLQLPIWAFHNVHDPYQSVEKSRLVVNAITSAGGKFVKLTEYTETPGKQTNGKWPNAHKHAWITAYNDDTLWKWLFNQRRGSPERALEQ